MQDASIKKQVFHDKQGAKETMHDQKDDGHCEARWGYWPSLWSEQDKN